MEEPLLLSFIIAIITASFIDPIGLLGIRSVF
jgi:hypothetical protein